MRQDWAQYYDNITTMDRQAQGLLDQLEKDGLTADTIVFFYGDNGSGMPRSKRWPYNSGLHVPLIVHIPEKFLHLASKEYRPGGVSGHSQRGDARSRMVSSQNPVISADGQVIAFESYADNFTPFDRNGPESDVFAYDRRTGALVMSPGFIEYAASSNGGIICPPVK